MTPAKAVAEIDELITLHLEGTQRTTAHAVLYRALRPALDSGDAPAALGALRRVLAAFDGHHSPAATPDHRRALAALRAAQARCHNLTSTFTTTITTTEVPS